MFLYEFDTIGIVYTVCTAVPIVLLFTASIVFCSRRAYKSGLTVAFRVLDIVLLVAAVICWAAYILMRVTIAGVNITAVGNDAYLMYEGSKLLKLSGCAPFTEIARTLLGTLLLAVLTALSVVTLILSFVRRACATGINNGSIINSENDSAVMSVEYSAESDIVARPMVSGACGHTETVQPEPSEEIQPEDREVQPEPSEEIQPEDREVQPELSEAVQPEDREVQPEPSNEDRSEEYTEHNFTATLTPEAESHTEPEQISETDESDAAVVGADTEQDIPPVIEDYSDRARGTSDKKYNSALQMPGAKQPVNRQQTKAADRVQLIRPAAPTASGYIRQSRPLPITRKLVITNRMNVVNMYNEYLKEKQEHEKITEAAAGPVGEDKK